MITTIALGGLAALLSYKVYGNQQKSESMYEEFDRLNRLVWDLENELLDIRSSIVDSRDALNTEKMSHEKTKRELEDKALTWENQYNQIKNEGTRD